IWEPTEERLNSVNEEVIRLSHLVNQLKNLAKFDNEKNVLNLSKTNLSNLIKNIIYNNESYGLEKNIKINSDLEEIEINIDKEKISQVIVNLISNAIRYTCDNGHIFIKCYKEEDIVKIHVIDNGRGIPKESLAYIFERFYRVDDSRCRKTGGTGVGLTICKSIIDLHHGKIEVISEENKGSEFIVTLPVK
ncbi:MAG: ATP-binding protein, partial [Terrisporobacter sp.]|uniref:sensor histidine kinase n=1 Tax=Terrisporobacter sp. TaxID=1965305 RepID=UPI002FCBBC53